MHSPRTGTRASLNTPGQPKGSPECVVRTSRLPQWREVVSGLAPRPGCSRNVVETGGGREVNAAAPPPRTHLIPTAPAGEQMASLPIVPIRETNIAVR